MSEHIEFEFNEKKGFIVTDWHDRPESWSWNGASGELISSINPVLALQIHLIVEEKVIAFVEDKKRKENEKREALEAERTRKNAEFEAIVIPLINTDVYTVKIEGDQVCRITRPFGKENINAAVFYDPLRNTLLSWIMRNPEGRHLRYSTLEKAVNAAMKSVDGTYNKYIAKEARNTSIKQEQEEIKQVFDAAGVTLVQAGEWVRTNYMRSTYRNKDYVEQQKNTAVINILPRTENYGPYARLTANAARKQDEILLNNVSLRGIITLNQFKALGDFIKTLNVQKE